MSAFVEKIANLIDVKTIVTIMVMVIFAVLSIRGDITPDNVVLIVSMVVSFYFGTQHQKKVAATEPVTATTEESSEVVE